MTDRHIPVDQTKGILLPFSSTFVCSQHIESAVSISRAVLSHPSSRISRSSGRVGVQFQKSRASLHSGSLPDAEVYVQWTDCHKEATCGS
jgi:hypothetical protein